MIIARLFENGRWVHATLLETPGPSVLMYHFPTAPRGMGYRLLEAPDLENYPPEIRQYERRSKLTIYGTPVWDYHLVGTVTPAATPPPV